MPTQSKHFLREDMFSRLFADFLIVHTSLIVALVASWIRATHAAPQYVVLGEARNGIDQYLHLFLPLSLIFPASLALMGNYSGHRDWSIVRRIVALLSGLVMGFAIFCSVSLLLLSANSLGPRSLLIFFTGLALMLFSVRTGEWAWVATLRARIARQEIFRSQKPVLVIGGAGYIGSALVTELLNSGRKVRVLDSLLYGDGALRKVIHDPRLELMVGDRRNLKTVIRAVKDVESIVDLAAIVGDPACEQGRQTALETNYAATRMLVEVAKGYGVSRLLFASSCSVYGASDELMDENSRTVPVSLYGQTKIDSERALLNAADSTFHPTILRLATVFGLSERPRFDLVVNLLAAKAASGQPVTIFNGDQWRPFIHVADAVRGFVAALDAPLERVSGEVFNLGDERLNYTLTNVADIVRQVFPEAAVEESPTTDRRNYRVSFDKIHRSLGFECNKDLVYGVRQIQAAFASGAILDYTSYQYSNQKFLAVSGYPNNQDEMDERVMAAYCEAPLMGENTPIAIAAAAGYGGSSSTLPIRP